jgi:hypothetical protein
MRTSRVITKHFANESLGRGKNVTTITSGLKNLIRVSWKTLGKMNGSATIRSNKCKYGNERATKGVSAKICTSLPVENERNIKRRLIAKSASPRNRSLS